MDVKNGIIVDGVIHEHNEDIHSACANCSLKDFCSKFSVQTDTCLCTLFEGGSFVERGKVEED